MINSSKSNSILFWKWAFICKGNIFDKYAEFKVIDEHYVTLRTLHSEGETIYKIDIKKGLIKIGKRLFRIVSLSDTRMELISGREKYVCYKIVLDDIILYNDQIDPFYLRQCYFLEYAGFMTKRDALQYISDNRWVPIDSIPKEQRIKEIILIDNSKNTKAKQIK